MANNKKEEKKVYRDGLGEIKNPANTGFGKFMIWLLAILMFGVSVFSLIWVIVEMASK